MPTIAGNVPSSGGSTPQKRRLRSDSVAGDDPICTTPSKPCSPVKWKSPRRCLSDSPRSPPPNVKKSPVKWKSPRRCLNDSPRSPPNRIDSSDKSMKAKKSPVKKLFGGFHEKPIWNPTDSEQLSAVKEALHVSTAPPTIVCRETEQKRVLEFCKQCIEKDKAGSLYMCGLPGTGKSLSMVNVKESLFDWTAESGFQSPDVLAINCTSFSNTSDIFSKILGTNLPSKRTKGSASPLWRLQQLYSKKQASCTKMTLVIADEMDYLITKDRAVLHDLFMLTTFPYSRCILIGIANAIDLADRFLPKLQSLNCKPMVVSFRAYSRDQIIMILKQRLMELPYTVFQPQALELCARKVAAVSGDMRKALCVCRSAIEIVEAELREFTCSSNLTSMEMGISEKQPRASFENLTKNNINIVRVDHMANALSKAYRSPIVESIQSLPQHQQIVLCSAVKHFRRGKKDTTVGELYKSYLDVCKSTLIPPVGIMELSCMCRVLADQGILKLGQSRDDKSRRVTLQIEEADVTFALQGIRFFRNCLQ